MTEPDRVDLSLVVPVRDDAGYVRPVLERICAEMEQRPTRSWEILVVDDASEDETCREVLAFALQNPRVLLLHDPGALGCGYAARHGIQLSRGERICLTSPDPEIPISEIRRMDRALDEGHDLAVYSFRARDSKSMRPVLIRREVLRSAVRAPVRAVRGDAPPARPFLFQLYRRRAALEIFRRQRMTGSSFALEILYLARRYGYSVVEIGPSESRPPAPGGRFREPESGVRELLRIRIHRLRGDYG